jgi:HEPN domain-containing protein
LNRAELQRLSDERIEDARVLLAAKRWPAAYYVAGYALECALKSCVLAYIDRTGIIFEDKKYAQKCWTHDIEDLVRQAGLTNERDKAAGTNIALGQRWLVAKDWSESSRYRLSTQLQAEKLFNALTDITDGVLPWLKDYW